MDLCRLADCIERTHRRWTIQKGLQSQGWGYVCWVSPCLFILSQEAFSHTPRLPPHQYSTSIPPQPQPQPQRAAPAQAPASRSWCGTNTRAADCNPAATSSCCGGRGVKGVAKFVFSFLCFMACVKMLKVAACVAGFFLGWVVFPAGGLVARCVM